MKKTRNWSAGWTAPILVGKTKKWVPLVPAQHPRQAEIDRFRQIQSLR